MRPHLVSCFKDRETDILFSAVLATLSTSPTWLWWVASPRLPQSRMPMPYGSTTHLYPTIASSRGPWMWLQLFAQLQSRSVSCIAVILIMLSFPQIQASGQRIEYFEKLQLQCKFDQPLRIPLHSNIRWGSAQRMLDRSYKLRKVRSICCVLRPALTCAMFSVATVKNQGFQKCVTGSANNYVTLWKYLTR